MTDRLRIVLCAAGLAVALACAAPPVTAAAGAPDRLVELASALHALDEDIEDTGVSMAEFTLFDECMFLVGVSARSGYWFGPDGRRPALFFDLGYDADPQYEVLAFPAEEPPGIECNEDAREEESDE